MGDSLLLAWHYLRYQRWKTAILVASITLVLFLPAALQVLVQKSAEQLTDRARRTPLILGAKGSELELVLNTLYFESRRPPVLAMSAVSRIQADGLATAIPLHVRFQARGAPIIGTTLDYFAFRNLAIAKGRMLGMLGECLLGADVARRLKLDPDDTLLSSPETFFDLAGVYPLKMRVVGILSRTGGPDDRSVFVDLKSSWIMEGLGHGHQDLTTPDAEPQLLRRDSGEVTANASVVQYTEITAENVGSFHFHGDQGAFPVTAIIARPTDPKSATILQGRFQAPNELLQLVRPLAVVEHLLATVFAIRSYVLLAAGVVAVATCLSVGLIFVLSAKLRQREIETLLKIGASRLRIAMILASEVVITLVMAGLLAASLTVGAAASSDLIMRFFIRTQ